MKKTMYAVTAALAAVMLVAPSTAQAQAFGPTCSLSDLSFGGTISSACWGAYEGNDVPNNEGFIAGLLAPYGAFTVAGKSDDANAGPFVDNPGGTTGTLTLDEAIGGTFAVSLKGGNYFSVYLFQSAPTASTFSYDTDGLEGAGLSHATLWTGRTTVPEPSSLAMLGLGLVGLVAARRRKA